MTAERNSLIIVAYFDNVPQENIIKMFSEMFSSKCQDLCENICEQFFVCVCGTFLIMFSHNVLNW